ncbi:hypothetical protein NDU88_005006 [Pleurodeles waltl]|uniref:Calcineurin-like phosphoesterase domain-containing protein n=1 Tax=Pleurodeles waltl TaxID=8319 RepID=A0AAV7W6Y1_PLEWA|nr:hypothetical protein NDU88_005006 [Pleurodeles waltl]
MSEEREPPLSLKSVDSSPMPPPSIASPTHSIKAEPQSVLSHLSDLTILHFNDVYEVEPRQEDPVGGAARFVTAVKKFSSQNPLIIFSGDCLNPSVLSKITKGRHMISILNSIGVHFAVFGNHEFDFGVDLLQDVMQEMQCQWFLSNVFDTFTSQPLGHGLVQKILEWNKLKIGLMGLVEEDWLGTLGTVDKANLQYIDYVVIANQLAVDLRARGAEFVIAMTHMRWGNDFRLAQNCQGVDLVLGGHDHEYGVKKVRNTWIVKSGSDFRNLTEIRIKNNSGSLEYAFQKIDIMQNLNEDEFVKAIVHESTLNLQILESKTELTSYSVSGGEFPCINLLCFIQGVYDRVDLPLIRQL